MAPSEESLLSESAAGAPPVLSRGLTTPSSLRSLFELAKRQGVRLANPQTEESRSRSMSRRGAGAGGLYPFRKVARSARPIGLILLSKLSTNPPCTDMRAAVFWSMMA